MGSQPLLEENPRWLVIMRHLEAKGARRVPGYRERQDVIADELGIGARQLRTYLKAMEGYDVLSVRRTTVDQAFGSPRGFNIYLLKVSADHWEQVLGPAMAARRREVLSNRASAVARNQQREKRRLSGAPAPRREQRPRPTPAVLSDEERAVLVAGQSDVSDDELAGW